MKKYLFIVLVLMTYTNVGIAQNLVPNLSFENLDGSHPNSPTDLSQLQHLQHWKNFNSSDLLSSEVGKKNGRYEPNNTVLQAHTGTKYIGFGPCEGAQVKLINPVEKMHWVTVSFWFTPRDFRDTEINVYLLENEAPSNALDDCFNPDIEFEAHFTIPVRANNFFGTAEHVPGTWYHYVSEPQLVADNEYDWVAIKGKDISGDIFSYEYVYVDDFTVESFEFCDHLCINASNDPIEFTNVIPNAAYGNSTSNFFTTVKNATSVEFLIWDSFNSLSYYWYSFDPNGLVDPGYSDFAIVWNGNSTTSAGDFIGDHVYTMRIIASNCNEVYQHDGHIYFFGVNEPPADVYSETQNRESPDCCPDYKFIQNTVYSGNDLEAVDDFIHAGSNVTTPPNGPVIVESTADVSFRAGNYIYIEPGGLTINSGGLFEAKIEPCGASPKSMIYSERDYYESMRDSVSTIRKSSSETMSDIIVYPNPHTGEFNIQGLQNNHVRAEVMDVYGSIVYECEITNSRQKISMNNVSAGVYFLKVYTRAGDYERIKMMITH